MVNLGYTAPDSKVRVANMEPAWDPQDPGGAHVGHVDLAIRVTVSMIHFIVFFKQSRLKKFCCFEEWILIALWFQGSR